MGRRRDKVAVSIPRELLARVEALRKRSGENRSAVFERALSDYVAAADAGARARRYVEAYRRRPEGVQEQRAALAASRDALTDQEWDA